MDWSNIVVAVIALIGTFIGSYSGIRLMSYRIEQLEKKLEKLSEKQDKYNNLQERIALVEKDIRVANHRIDDLEKTTTRKD